MATMMAFRDENGLRKGFSHLSAIALVLLSAASIINNQCEAFTSSTTTTKSPRISHTQIWSTAAVGIDRTSSSSASSGSTFGPTVVDMNQYNLDLDDIAQEWKAEIVPESSLREEGVYLGAKSSKEIMVDTFKIEFPRIIGQGLGIELLELAGGRSDGLGITVINGLVEGGTADTGISHENDLMIGDSISKIAIKRTKKGSDSSSSELSDVEEIDSIDVECFGYDKTVDAILNLPPQNEDIDNEYYEESFVLTIKRLRRKPKVIVELQYPPDQNEPDTTIELFSGENLRRALINRGIVLEDPKAPKCDFCGTKCSVKVDMGMPLLSPMSTTESKIMARNPKCRVSCKTVIGYNMQEGNLRVKVNLNEWSTKDKKTSNPFFSK